MPGQTESRIEALPAIVKELLKTHGGAVPVRVLGRKLGFEGAGVISTTHALESARARGKLNVIIDRAYNVRTRQFGEAMIFTPARYKTFRAEWEKAQSEIESSLIG